MPKHDKLVNSKVIKEKTLSYLNSKHEFMTTLSYLSERALFQHELLFAYLLFRLA
jgi:hypothetical protein